MEISEVFKKIKEFVDMDLKFLIPLRFLLVILEVTHLACLNYLKGKF